MTEDLNQFGRPVIMQNVPAKDSAHWQLPLIRSFLRFETNGTRDGTSVIFKLANLSETRLSLKDTFDLRGYASSRSQQFPQALDALNMAFKRADDVGLMTVEVNFPGQVPTFD